MIFFFSFPLFLTLSEKDKYKTDICGDDKTENMIFNEP